MSAEPTSKPQLSRRPSDLYKLAPTHAKAKLAFIAAGFLSLCLSVGLWAAGHQTEAIFVGLWVPSFHSLGALLLAGERHER